MSRMYSAVPVDRGMADALLREVPEDDEEDEDEKEDDNEEDEEEGEGYSVECTLGLRHEAKGVVAVRCKIIVRQCWLWRIVSSR